MLQRILASFQNLPGAEQAYLVSKQDGLISAVGKRGKSPDLDFANLVVQELENLGRGTLGEGLELWIEGEETVLVTRLSSDTSLVIRGKKSSRIARWRHAVDRDTEVLNSLVR
ncbi:MAG: hypothetical protein CMA91_07265 [Euryarchaeota archaeon]|nr:hypothetical protein [Euryarchaeota archaeon]|tara:strand:+ start:275 stop:613 length:339 start_codon:yes stop_codon:yes gene_type:complete